MTVTTLPLTATPSSSQMHVVAETNTVVGREAVIRTTMGDIRTKLFPDECPKVCSLLDGAAAVFAFFQPTYTCATPLCVVLGWYAVDVCS